jgi:hypothetical protein
MSTMKTKPPKESTESSAKTKQAVKYPFMVAIRAVETSNGGIWSFATKKEAEVIIQAYRETWPHLEIITNF